MQTVPLAKLVADEPKHSVASCSGTSTRHPTSLQPTMNKGPAFRPGPCVVDAGETQGVIWLTRVDQFATEPRVWPQVGSLLNCANVHVCAMYSFAIQMLFPDACAAG